MRFLDPVQFQRRHWPGIYLYDRQWDIWYSVLKNKETFVISGNKTGKDYVGALIALHFFLSALAFDESCREISTSVKDDHLDVLWDEMHTFIADSAVPLTEDKGGPLRVQAREIRFSSDPDVWRGRRPRNEVIEKSYLKRQVSEHGEGMAGHHAERTMLLYDECSAMKNIVRNAAMGWMHKGLYWGNPFDCANDWRKEFERGNDLPWRSCIKLPASEVPNVKLGILERRAGLQPSYKRLVKGLLTYAEWEDRERNWKPDRKAVGLYAEFYEGEELKLFPPLALQHAWHRGREVSGYGRVAKAIGIDTAEGGDRTAWAVVDEWGLIDLHSLQTPDTSVIPGMTIDFMRRYKLLDSPQHVCFDRSGGGKEHADVLRRMGFNVRTVAFGDPMTLPVRRAKKLFPERFEMQEDKSVYKNRRAEMYYELSQAFDPSRGQGFAVPDLGDFTDRLKHQLSKMPRLTDPEGKYFMLPKSPKRKATREEEEEEDTLIKRIGYSPDESDALAVACFAMNHKPSISRAGAVA